MDGQDEASTAGLSRELAAARAAVRQLQARLDEIEELAEVGDFDWDVTSGQVTRSDQLCRIHGTAPQRTPVPYEQLLDAVHPEDRESVKQGHLHALATGEPYFATERIVRPDGDIRVVDTSAVVHRDADGTPVRLRGASVEVTGRWRIEMSLRRAVAKAAERAEDGAQLEARLQDAQLRRRQAVGINDNIIQGVAAAIMAVEAGRTTSAGLYLHRTLDAARRMMGDLLAPLDGADLDPTDLIRDEAVPGHEVPPDEEPAPHVEGGITVLVVDDADDLRFLLRYTLQADGRFRVVGEATDGLEAIAQAEALQPQVILLDVAMPRLDGLGALPRIRVVAPDAVIIVLSGFGADQMAGKAREAGAAAYVEKGAATADIIGTIQQHLPSMPDN